jgi:ribosomal protein S15P/S13E
MTIELTLISQDDCQWDSREDYRKPLPRQQVQALVTRVDYLERLLKEHGIDEESTRSQRQSVEHTRDIMQEQDRRGGVEDGDPPRDLSLDHLVSQL